MKTPKLNTIVDKLSTPKRSQSSLKFPLDVDTTGTQNIMMININAVSGSTFAGKQYRVVEGESAKVQQRGSNSLHKHFAGNTVRIDTSIAFFMPPNLEFNYNADWNASELGVAGSVIEQYRSIGDTSSFEAWQGAFNSAAKTLPDVLKMTGIKLADSLLPGNIQDAGTWANQIVENPFVEVLFNGVSNRTFSFTFRFVPKSKEEQIELKKIIDTLKFHRAPERKAGVKNLYWSYPSTFDITFLNKQGEENPWVSKISTCALTDLNIQSGGDNRFASHEDSSPVSTTITMNFTELEVLDKDRILQGF